jgi:hypothetical protein
MYINTTYTHATFLPNLASNAVFHTLSRLQETSEARVHPRRVSAAIA